MLRDAEYRHEQPVGDGEFAAMMLDRELEGALEKLVEYGLLLE